MGASLPRLRPCTVHGVPINNAMPRVIMVPRTPRIANVREDFYFGRLHPERGVAEFESEFRPALFCPFDFLELMSDITALTGKLLHLNIASGASATEKSSSTASKLPIKSNSSPTTATLGVFKAPPNNASKSEGVACEQTAGPSTATSKPLVAKTTGSSKETQRPALTRHDDLATAPVQGDGEDGAAVTIADIGTYDGELENDQRGLEVTGDAAEDLSLDSSISR